MNTALTTLDTLTPKSIGEAKDLAELLAGSGMVPKCYIDKPGAIIAAVQLGATVGLSWMQSLQNIAVVNGMPTIWGDAALALVRQHPDFLAIDEDPAHVALANKCGRCKLSRRSRDGEVESVEHKFDEAQATAAGLTKKDGTWQTYRGRMYQARARSWAIRDLFGDVMKGLTIREEVEDFRADFVTPDGVEVQMPRRKGASAQPAPEAAASTPAADPQRAADAGPTPSAAAAAPVPAITPEDDKSAAAAKPTSGHVFGVISVTDKPFNNGKRSGTLYTVTLEDVNGHFGKPGQVQASTFSRSLATKANGLVNKFATADLKAVQGNDGRTFLNLLAIEFREG